MSTEILSLLALLTVVIVGCFVRVNVGVLSLILAFGLGQFAAGMSVDEIAAGFPVKLFLRLTGITLLFSLAAANGTLSRVARLSVRLVGANRSLVPLLFFGFGVVLASSGAGNFAATAMLAPIAMGVAGEFGISPLLMAVMLVNGASAGAFSPVAPTGMVASDLMDRMGLPDSEWPVYLNSLAAHSVVALAGYFLLRGWKLGRDTSERTASHDNSPWSWTHGLTVLVITAFVVSSALLGLEVAAMAFFGAGVLALTGAATENTAFKSVPWGVILMVCGVTTLIEVITATGGMGLFTRFLASVSGPEYAPGVTAAVAGVVSIYASSIGVVMPAFLPAVPQLVRALGAGNPLMLAFSINVGAHLVDISPLSPLGAMCLAFASPREDRNLLFRKLMAVAWSMSIVGGLLCQLLFGYR